VNTVVDMGALFVRAIKINEKGKVLDYKMTGQCASGSGQFIENISRYLGLSIEEVGDISLQAETPETPSGICAVLAETDVINMVSRGITTPNIIKGFINRQQSCAVTFFTKGKISNSFNRRNGNE